MIRRGGGCTTTAFALTVGSSADPAVSLRVELLCSWIQVLRDTVLPKGALERVWSRQRDDLRGLRRWSKVRGPMAAVVATLFDLGLDPKELLQWTDDVGNEWAIDPEQAGVVPRIAAMIRDRSIRQLWKKAGSHFCGEGIGDSEADLTAHRKIRKEFLKNGDFKRAGILDMVAQGASWPI